MGLHAFTSQPEHCEIYRAHLGPNVPRVFGLDELWNMPVSRHRRSLGAGMEFRGVNHYVLTYHMGGPKARRADARDAADARTGALSLQQPMSGGLFSSKGVVEYGHFYFKQSLICEVAGELGLGIVAEPEDFFALQHPAWGRDVEAYIFRALDFDDPPSSIEMDGRAYIIIVGLLRAALKRSDLTDKLKTTTRRRDVCKVVEAIDDRIAEPLRLSELAGILDMSPFHFARVFKEATGLPPAQYIMRRRTERAIEMLEKTSMPLSELSFRAGFSSQSHMTRHVKQMTGKTPTTLRRDH
jgi:AraC family transcriptional regulator